MPEAIMTPMGTRLPDGWRLERLGPLCRKIGSGATPKGGSAVYEERGISFIRSQNVFDHAFSRSGLAFINQDAADRLQSVAVEPQDVLLNITGDGETIARCCVAPTSVLPARVNQHVAIIRTGSDLVPEFLQRYLSHPAIREYMLNHNSGGSRRALTKAHIESFEVVLPPRATQEAIAQALGAIDDKIAVNEHITATLRSLGKALFDDAIGSTNAQVCNLSSVSSAIVRGAPPTYVDDVNEMVVLNQRCIRAGQVGLGPARRTISAKVRADRILKNGDVLVNSTGVGTLGRVAIWTGDSVATCDSHVTIVRTNPELAEPIVVGYAMLRVQPEIEGLGEGSTGQTELSRHKLGQLLISLPDPSIQKTLAQKLNAFEWRSYNALQENAALAALRDVLLPQLVSGRFRIKDSDQILSDEV